MLNFQTIQTNQPMNRTMIKIVLTLPFLISLGACTSIPSASDILPQIRIPSVDFNTLPDGKDILQANSFLKAGKKREAASAYFSASKKYRSPQRDRLILQAAELAASFRDMELTQRYLAPINFSKLNKENQARYRYTQTQLALNDKNYREVLRILPQRVNGLPYELAEKILKTRMIAAKSSQDKLALIQELVLQEPTLAEAYQVRQNNNRIWNHVLLMSKNELESSRKTIKHPTLKGWLELGYLVNTLKGKGGISPIFHNRLLNWQKHYPNHPGNEKVLQLLNYRTTTTPYLGGIKPSKT